MKIKAYIESVFLIFLGILTSLSLPPLNYLIINFFTFSLFFIFLINKANQHSIKKFFFLYGWLFGLGYFGSNLYWISISLTFDQNFKFLIPYTLILIPAFLSIFYGAISFFFIILKPSKVISGFFSFSLIFGILEFVRGSIFTGFPWNLIAYSFSSQLEILSVTSIIGTYGFNLFCITLFTSPSLLFLGKLKYNKIIFGFFIFLTISFYVYGNSYKDTFSKTLVKDYDYKLRVIGSNIGLKRFYENTDITSVLQELIKISNPEASVKTIFVWPEGILPDIYQDELIQYGGLFNEKFNKNHFLILGINSRDTSKRIDFFNSFSLYDNELNLLDSYNKIKLVPFGEFLPFEKILGSLGLKSLTNNYQSFSKGNMRNIIKINKGEFSLKILPLICYEIIYSGELFDNSNFDLIVNISEDGWFGQSIGPKQHFAHSIFRAIESGKYVLRSANNGIAAIINPLGEIQESVKFGQSGYADLKDVKKIKSTIFFKYGNKVFGLLILLYILFIFSFNKINNERS